MGLLDDVLGSLVASHDPGVEVTVLLVDDASTDGSVAYVRQRHPAIEVLALESNHGFASACNAGWEHVRQAYPDTAYVVLLNSDTIVESGWLAALVQELEQHPEAGAAQAMLRLHPNKHLINTAGNRSHYLGFGYMTGYFEEDAGQYDDVGSIDYASGAAVAVRADLLKAFGLFDELFYMYLEDAELSWKLRLAGHDTRLAAGSVVYHKYLPNAPTKYYFYLERNRWVLLLTYYRWATLLLLSPALLAMECGQVLFALQIGKPWDRVRIWCDLLSATRVRQILARRRAAQATRAMPDREFVGRFAGIIRFGPVDTPVLRYVGNPILSAYWAIARRLIFW